MRLSANLSLETMNKHEYAPDTLQTSNHVETIWRDAEFELQGGPYDAQTLTHKVAHQSRVLGYFRSNCWNTVEVVNTMETPIRLVLDIARPDTEAVYSVPTPNGVAVFIGYRMKAKRPILK